MTDKSSKTSYFNTLIFTIISGIVAIVLLLLLFFDIFTPYWYFIIALEIGILLIVIYCISQIVSNEKKIALWKEKGNFGVRFDACPEYYIKEAAKDSDNKDITNCTNSYIYTDRAYNQYVMKLYPDDKDLPSSTAYALDVKHEKFDLAALDKNTKLTTSFEKCGPVFSDSYSSNTSLQGYSSLPWLRVRSQCESYLK